MLRLVLDTNVVLDIFLFADPAALPLLAAARSGEVECCTDDACLAELARVVRYPEFGLNSAAGAALLTKYADLARVLPAPPPEDPPRLPRCKDPDDQKFLELASRAGADLLVSKDKALLALARKPHRPCAIVTPAHACAEIWPGR